MQGIYQLEFTDGSIYIGLSNNVGTRLSQHLRDLEKNTHKNKYVQAKFNKHGIPSFKVLEVTDRQELLDSLETKYINQAVKEDLEVLNIVKNPKTPILEELAETSELEELYRLNMQIQLAAYNLDCVDKELERLEDLRYEFTQALRKARLKLTNILGELTEKVPDLQDRLVAELGEVPDPRIYSKR